MICNKCGNEISGYEIECPSCREKQNSGMEDTISSLKASNCVDIDYKKEYKLLQTENHILKKELKKYKQALLNICLKFKE